MNYLPNASELIHTKFVQKIVSDLSFIDTSTDTVPEFHQSS